MRTISAGIDDYNSFLTSTLLEGASIFGSTSAESYRNSTHMTSIATEGFIGWAKDKLKAIGRKFVIVTNKILARFSKNREELEANIEEYKNNPHAEVELAVSGSTLRSIASVSAGLAAAAGAILLVRNRKGGEEAAEKVKTGILAKVRNLFGLIKRDKSKGKHKVSGKELASASELVLTSEHKVAKTVKQGQYAISSSGNRVPKDKGLIRSAISNVAKATKDSLMLLHEEAAMVGEFIRVRRAISDYSKGK